MDRHTRPYKCDMPNCIAPPFGDAGGLFRHRREVHRRNSSNVQIGDGKDSNTNGDTDLVIEHFCPEESCQRSLKGFPRRWNLREHQRRVHQVQLHSSAPGRAPRHSDGDRDGANNLKRSISTVSCSSSASVTSNVAKTADTSYPLRADEIARDMYRHTRNSHAQQYSRGGDGGIVDDSGGELVKSLQSSLQRLEEKRQRLQEDTSRVTVAIENIQQLLRC